MQSFVGYFFLLTLYIFEVVSVFFAELTINWKVMFLSSNSIKYGLEFGHDMFKSISFFVKIEPL